MVMMVEEDISFYPYLAQFVKNHICKLPQKKPQVFAKFMDFGQLTPAAAKRALTWDMLPVLKVTPLRPGLYGIYDPGKAREVVFVNTTIALQFESFNSQGPAGGIQGLPGELDHIIVDAHLLVESKILHEMVHWGDFTADDQHHSFEAGRAFEKKVYGRYLTNETLRLKDWMGHGYIGWDDNNRPY